MSKVLYDRFHRKLCICGRGRSRYIDERAAFLEWVRFMSYGVRGWRGSWVLRMTRDGWTADRNW
jgi:hypothetical protein